MKIVEEFKTFWKGIDWNKVIKSKWFWIYLVILIVATRSLGGFMTSVALTIIASFAFHLWKNKKPFDFKLFKEKEEK